MMSHTPGPWRIDTKESLPDWEVVVDAKCHIVANVNVESGPDIPPAVSIKMPAKANAHLIAAAPDMLKVLEWLDIKFDCLDDGYGRAMFSRSDFKKVRAAIKKARGNE